MSVEINATNFPDQYLRNYVSTYDRDNDGYLSDTELELITAISWYGPDWNPTHFDHPVSSLQGIEYLTSLKTISVYGFLSLTGSIDVRNFRKLESLRIVETNITSVDVRGCEKLTDLSTQSSPINSLLFENNSSLQELNVGWMSSQNPDHQPNIGYLDLSQCPALTLVNAYSCGLTGINVSECPDLERLFVFNNSNLSSLDITRNQKLRKLEIQGTNISSINIAKCPVLKNLYDNYPRQQYSNVVYYNLADNENYPQESTPYRLSYTTPTTSIISSILRITTQPQSVVVDEDDTASFHIRIATEESDITYQWEYKRPGDGVWIVIINSDTQDYSVVAENGMNNYQYRCLISCEEAMVYSNIATLTVYSKPRLVSEPLDQTANEGSTVTFGVEATGTDLSYQWQYSEDGGTTWVDIQSANQKNYVSIADSDNNENLYRCVIENRLETIYSDSAELTVNTDTRSIQPSSLTLIEGSDAIIEVIPKNDPNAENSYYQWQYSSDNGNTWSDLRYETDDTFTVHATLGIDGVKYRCKVNNSIRDIYTDPITLTVTADQSLAPPTITTHPSSLEITEGNNATFSIVASGNNLSYQWQTFKNGTWYNINGANSASYTTLASTSLNGNRYRCQVSNAAGGVYSNTATLTVTSSAGSISTPSINTQPRSANVNDGQTAIFSLAANGGGLSYQWYIKRNGQWYPISGATHAIYSVIGRSANNGTQYRCLVTNSAGSVYSNVVDLNVQSSAPLSFYGYHSIIISGKNTYGEWEMYPTSRPHVAPPEVKTSYVDVPGADGGLDYTDLLTGEPRFGYRKGSWEFLLIPQERWPDVYRSLCNFLNGRVHTVVLEDDPTWQYTGRLSVNKWESAAHNSLITIDYILDPNPVNLDDESYNTDEDDLAAAARILRKPGNEGMVIGMFNGSATIVDPATYFEDGDNISY